MEKDSDRHYRAYESLKSANNGNTSSLKRGLDISKSSNAAGHRQQQQQQNGQIRCLCFGGVPDKASHHSFLKGFVINLGICALLVAYTLLGSFIFLAIEGGAEGLQQRTLATTIASGDQPSRRNTTAWLNKVNRDARIQTVESIWEITENLNILYRENWTRLAEQEIARFQDRLVKKITDNMLANSQNTGTYTGNHGNAPADAGPSTERTVPDYEWNFAKAFLYSLTVLTTIGMIDGGVGEMHLNTTFSALNIPTINHNLLKRYERIVGPVLEDTAKDSCLAALKTEKALTIANERNACKTDVENVPLVIPAPYFLTLDALDKECPAPENFEERSNAVVEVLPSTSASSTHIQPSTDTNIEEPIGITASYDAGWQ